jgi:acyl-CoA thioester hydrolase
MGVVYHTHYLDYFEAARTEALRALGVAYRDLEDAGIFLPVVDVQVRYRRPAQYDDLLAVEVTFPEPPSTRVRTTYAVRRLTADDRTDNGASADGASADGAKARGAEADAEAAQAAPIVTGEVTLCFVDGATRRPTAPPEVVQEAFAQVMEG